MKAIKLHHVGPSASERGTIGEEPDWSNNKEVNYKTVLGTSLNWYNYLCDHKNYAKFMQEWIAAMRPETAKKDLSRLDRLSEKEVNATTATLARMQLRGFPLSVDHEKIIHDFVNDLKRLDKVKKVDEDKPTGISVQDRMRQQVSGVLSDIDKAVDDVLVDSVKVDFDKLRDSIFNPSFKAPHLAIIEKYLKHYIEEWEEAVNAMNNKFKDDTSHQLAEGYAYTGGTKFLNNAIQKFGALRGTLATEGSKVKMQRIRKKKPVDKKKMVAKLKYLKVCEELGLTSINPVDIIGASSLWVYDCKKRKLGYYEGEFSGSLHIKGTTVLGVKPAFQKILRKPEAQMKEFVKLRKNQVVNYFTAIRAKSQELVGRTNTNLILLRVD